MTREEHKEHSDDFAKGNISAGAFVLFQQIRIGALEAQLKAKENDLERQDMIIKCLSMDLDSKEKLLKAKDDEIRRLNNLYADTIKDLGDALIELELMKESNECDALQNAVDSLEAQLKPLVATCYKSCDTCKHEHENGTDYPCCACKWRWDDNYESKDF